MFLNKTPSNNWLLQPFDGSPLMIGSKRAPNWFHRKMQRWMLGFVWTPLGDKSGPDLSGNPVRGNPAPNHKAKE